jgi:hypothetical protein
MRKKPKFKSFHVKPVDQEQLDYICKAYGENPSAVLRRLIERAYTELKVKAEAAKAAKMMSITK